MEESSPQKHTDGQNPSSTAVDNSSSSLREQISLKVLQYVLFGINPVKMMNIYETSRLNGSGDDKDPEISTTKTEKAVTSLTKETDNRQLTKANLNLIYTVASFPDEVTLCLSSIPGTKYGVCAKQHIPVGTWIGPYEGKRVSIDDATADINTSNMWEIYRDNKLDYFLDGSDKKTSSWMRFIRCARHKQEQNLFAFQHNKSIFYRAFRDIPRGCELLVWYEDSYTQHMGIPLGIANKSSERHTPGKRPSVKHPIAVRMSRLSSLSGEHEIFVGADRGSGPSRGNKRRSQPLYSLLLQGTPDESSTAITQRHSKRFRIHHEISENDSLSYSETTALISRAGADDNKKPGSSEQESSHDRKIFEEVRDNIRESGDFKCGQCKTTFTQRSLLNNHLCSRMPCKPYRCGHCQEAFAQPKELCTHAVVHVSEKPFKCGYCLRSFSGATTLNNHVRTHTGEKPFVCEGCGKSFTQAFQLSRHRRICGQHAD